MESTVLDVSNYSVFGAPPPESSGFDPDWWMERLARIATRVSSLPRAARAAIGVTLSVAGLVIALLTPVGTKAALGFIVRAGHGSEEARMRTCAATFCSRPATASVRYAKGHTVYHTVYYCEWHVESAPKTKTVGSGWGFIALPFFLLSLALLLAGAVGPLVPLLLLQSPPPAIPAVVAATTSWILAIPAAWAGALLFALLYR